MSITIADLISDIPIIGEKDLTEQTGFIEIGNPDDFKKIYDPIDVREWTFFIKAVCRKYGLKFKINKDWC